MYGTVHVMPTGALLPYTQAQYDKMAGAQLFNITTNLNLPRFSVLGSPRVFTVGKIVATGGFGPLIASLRRPLERPSARKIRAKVLLKKRHA
jgi:hypothetical protein